ncbi:MAG TPA: ComEC/Rec2 family competence protein [Candidatus Omnitrophota bacterium]|nr:ComEC/Rec2 family competence protein [Candidatus Omnitrophota bacterium]
MRNPFAWITLCFSLGIVCTSRMRITFPAAWGIALACCFLCAASARAEDKGLMAHAGSFFFFCAVFFCGTACLINADTLAGDNLSHILPRILNRSCVVSGSVASEPLREGGRTMFDIKAQRVTANTCWWNCSGALRVTVNGAVSPEYGDLVEASGNMVLPQGYCNGRGASVRERLRQKGILAVLRVPHARRVRIIKAARYPGPVCACMAAKRSFLRIIRGRLPPVAAAIMEAMVLGDKSGVPRSVYKDMIRSGTVHILVVSGFNVGIVSGACALLLKVMRLNRTIRLAVIVPAMVFYCVMTGASPPVVRATVMGIFLFSSWYVRRDPSIPQALSLSAFSILVFSPRQLYNASFQLSFAAVAGISLLSPAIGKVVRLDRISLRPLRWVAAMGVVSLSAWLGTAGFIAYYFRIISPVTVIANILIPAIASLITLCGAGLVIFGFLCPYAAISFASVSEFLILLMLRFNTLLINIPGAYWSFP